MKCPICEVDLQMTERQGVEIDYCPKCRGIWLDRGELDKIIEKSSSGGGNEAISRPQQEPYRDDSHHHDDKHGYYGQGYKKRKSSIIGDLFDF